MPNASDFTADLSRFPRWVDLDAIELRPSARPAPRSTLNNSERQTAMRGSKGMTGDARQQFMSSCPSNKPAAETKKPQCVNGRPCGNSCIAKDKVCHK
jgi:hypothetical protein